MTQEGKEADKLKECSKTTGPLLLLKELPRHSVVMGGRGSTSTPLLVGVLQGLACQQLPN